MLGWLQAVITSRSSTAYLVLPVLTRCFFSIFFAANLRPDWLWVHSSTWNENSKYQKSQKSEALDGKVRVGGRKGRRKGNEQKLAHISVRTFSKGLSEGKIGDADLFGRCFDALFKCAGHSSWRTASNSR